MNYLNCKQSDTQSPHEYLETMKALADNIEYQGGSVAESYMMIPERDPIRWAAFGASMSGRR